MAGSYFFDPSKCETPESIAQKRLLSQSLATRILGNTPRNLGEGLSAVGSAWIARMMMDEANDAQKAGMATVQPEFGGTAPNPAAGIAATIAGQPPVTPSAAVASSPMGNIPPPAAPTTGKIYSNDEPSPLDPPSGQDLRNMQMGVIGEAGNEPALGQNAVASVIRTRAVDGGYGGDTPTGVVTAPNQFEPFSTQAGRDRMKRGLSDPKQLAAANDAIDRAYGTGNYVKAGPNDPTEGMTHFYSPAGQTALGRKPPAWAGGESVTIGGHVFNSPDDSPGGAAPVEMASNDPAVLPSSAQPAQGALPSAQAVQAASQPVPMTPATPTQRGFLFPKASDEMLRTAYGNAFTPKPYRDAILSEMKMRAEAAQKAGSITQETDASGNVWNVNRGTGERTVALKADADPTSVKEYEFYKKNLAPGEQPMPYQQWTVAKARAGATNITNTIGGENKGLDEAAKLDAETVRKNQNEKMPALEDADHNFQLMQDAIERNGGKLPTGGVLGKLGLDARRTSNYIRDNWGIDLGDDPTTAVSLETFNKGGIKASGDMAKAIGGSRVLKVEFDMAQRANPGLETTDGGNKYLLDVNRKTIAIQRDHLQAQEDYWRSHNHSLDGFQKSWNAEVHANPRPLSSFSVTPPIDNGDGSQMVKLPSTAQGGYSWYRKGQDGLQPVADSQAAARLDDAAKPLKAAAAAPITKVIGNKTYIKQDGNWFEKQ